MAVSKKSVKSAWDKLDTIRVKIEEWSGQKQEELDKESSKRNPNDDKMERLEEENSILQDALQSLEECCSRLEDYTED